MNIANVHIANLPSIYVVTNICLSWTDKNIKLLCVMVFIYLYIIVIKIQFFESKSFYS